MADTIGWRGAADQSRRRLLARGAALSAGAAGVGTLAACAGAAGSNSGTSPAAVPTLRSGVSLTWLTGTDTPAHTEARGQQIAAFQQQRPGIKMEHQGVPDFAAKLQAALAAGTPPDLYFTRVADLTSQASRSQVLPLDDFAKRDAFGFGDFYPASIEQYRVAGKLHALPFDFPNQAFFCNMQAFEEAGIKPPPTTYKDDSWNFDAFRTTMEGIQRRKGPEGAFAVDTSRELRAWINWVWNNGGDLFSKDGKEVVLNQPAGVEALQFLQDLIYKYRVAPPEQERGTPQRTFVQGKLMLYSSGQPDIGVLRRDVGANFRWDVVPRPRGKGATRVATGGGSAFAMSAPGPNKEETWAFFKHIMSKPMQQLFMKGTGAMVAFKSLVESPDFQAPPPAHMSLFVEGASLLRQDPTAIRWADVQLVLNEELARLWTNAAQPKDVADSIKAKVDPLLKG